MEAVMEKSKTEKKQRMWPYYLLGAFLMYMAIASFKYFTTPRSYEECVMKNIQPGDSDSAAQIKAKACRQMFPNPYDRFDKK